MQAIVQTRYGAPDVLHLEQRPTPVPKQDELLVRIEASPVTAADTMMRRGIPYYGRLFLGLLKPRQTITGTGFSGVIEATGSAVQQFTVGEHVMGESVLNAGTHCQYVCVAQHDVISRKPENISHAEAATLCDGPVTSFHFLHRLGEVQAGHRVLINGAAGSLGSAAVQLAKGAGATVVGVCSTKNHEFVRSLGADEVIDYHLADPLNTGDTFDLVYDTIGNFSVARALTVLRADGRFLSPVLSLSLLKSMLFSRLRGNRQVRFSATGLLPATERLEILQRVARLTAEEKLHISISGEYALSDIVAANTVVDSGHKRGNIVVRP